MFLRAVGWFYAVNAFFFVEEERRGWGNALDNIPGKNDTEAVSFAFCGGLHHWRSSLGQQRYDDKKSRIDCGQGAVSERSIGHGRVFPIEKNGVLHESSPLMRSPAFLSCKASTLNNLSCLLLLLITQPIHRVNEQKKFFFGHQSQTPSTRQIRHPQRTRGEKE